MTNLQSDFDEKLALIKNNYLKTLSEKYNILSKLKNYIFNSSKDSEESKFAEDIKESYGYVHKLSGSSAIFGFSELSKISNKLELLLKNFIESNYSTDKNVLFQQYEVLLIEIEKILKEEAASA